jgi:hypothetical protein
LLIFYITASISTIIPSKQDIKMKSAIHISKSLALAAILVTVSVTPASAASSSDVTQVINAGVLSVDIMDASRITVASPTIAMSAKTFSFDCQNAGSSSTGSLGTNAQRLYVMNPSASTPNGWSVSLAPTAGATASWANTGATKRFDFNDAGGSGCTDGADVDAFSGQMTLNPTAGTLTTDCVSCTVTGVTKGSSTAYSEGSTNSITLLTASAGATNPWRGYLTGVGVSQTIPGEQLPDSTYALNMTMTVVAL